MVLEYLEQRVLDRTYLPDKIRRPSQGKTIGFRTSQGNDVGGKSIGTSFLPIVVNVSSLVDKKDLLEYTINTEDIKERIASQLNSDIKLIKVKPETITFKFSQFGSKKVPVIPQVDYTLKRQYMLKNNISVIPNEVEISGPASILDTLKGVYTSPLKLKELSKDVTKNVSFEEIPGTQISENGAGKSRIGFLSFEKEERGKSGGRGNEVL